METLEQKVADCILQQTSDTLEIEGHSFEICPPTPATLILISKLVSQLPVFDDKAENMMYEVLRTAKDLSIVGDICAAFIIGAKRIKENRKVVTKSVEYKHRWSWRKLRKVTEPIVTARETTEFKWLAEELLYEVTNETLVRLVAKRLSMMQMADFFALTTSLSVANHLKRTKEVEATASGAKS
ncbi:MAG: hypothetical protein LIO91_03770 [Bacteroidales bacterium]|nr:hypothetical protein [Bacteroidales bacterium]